jgi:hypothetical protein
LNGVLSAPQAQTILDDHEIEAIAYGGFSVTNFDPEAPSAALYVWIGLGTVLYGLLCVLWVVVEPPVALLAVIVAVALAAATLLPRLAGDSLLGIGVPRRQTLLVTNGGLGLTTSDVGGLAATKDGTRGATAVDWRPAPMTGSRFEVCAVDDARPTMTVTVTIGDRRFWASGPAGDEAFRLARDQRGAAALVSRSTTASSVVPEVGATTTSWSSWARSAWRKVS